MEIQSASRGPDGVSLERRVVRETPKAVVLSIAGEADASATPALEAACDAALREEEATYLLLDLQELKFASSAFMSVLVRWRETLRSRGGQLILFGLRAEIASTLRMVGLDRFLAIKPSEAEALELIPGA